MILVIRGVPSCGGPSADRGKQIVNTGEAGDEASVNVRYGPVAAAIGCSRSWLRCDCCGRMQAVVSTNAYARPGVGQEECNRVAKSVQLRR